MRNSFKTGYLAAFAAVFTLSAAAAAFAETADAVYLGVENYGAEETNRENMDLFQYRFLIDGEEKILTIDNGMAEAEEESEAELPQEETGDPYRIQNILKEGYSYEITIEDGAVTDAVETTGEREGFEPVVCGTPGILTVRNFLENALAPVGITLYIYGGGWNWQDDAAGIQTRTLGVSPDWVDFFNDQDENFTYKDRDGDEGKRDAATSYYPFGEYNEYYYAGLDCSGYVGWVIYNTLETESGKEGYVTFARTMAKSMADMGFGTMSSEVPAQDGITEESVKPGDIISLGGHTWISLGTCEDGSIVILHSTPSVSRTNQPGGGVQISAIGNDKSCEAMQLADTYMSKYYPEWYERYPAVLKDYESYFDFEKEDTGIFSFDTSEDSPFTDPDGLAEMRPAQVLAALFGE